MKTNLYITCCLLSLLLLGCGTKEKSVEEPFRAIDIPLTDSLVPAFHVKLNAQGQDLHHILEQVSYVPLSNDVVVGEIKRQLVADDKLYILDATSTIFSFDVNNGALLFTISSVGAGPTDYSIIRDMGIDREKKQILVYDSDRRQMLVYCSTTGRYLHKYAASHIAPHRIAVTDGTILLDNPDHFNFPNDPSMHYSLQFARFSNNMAVRTSYFPHDDISAYDLTFGSGHPFFYQDNVIFYNRRFDEYVYAVKGDSITPQLRIILDKAVPLDLIKEKIQAHELVRSPYAKMPSSIYSCSNILYFTFSYDSFIYQCFFDTLSGEQLYCDKMGVRNTDEKLPSFLFINGVADNRFFSVVDSYLLKQIPALKDIDEIEEESNPVLLFYKVKEKQAAHY